MLPPRAPALLEDISVFRKFPIDGNKKKGDDRGMIKSFSDETTKALFERTPVKKIPAELAKQAAKRLRYLDAATRIEDLYFPPSNDFHSVGKRFAISVNRQWRITFRWTESGPEDVLFEDYH